MKASCVITSEGKIEDTRKMPNVFRVRNLQKRISEIDDFINSFAALLNITPDSFIYKFQPFYTEDHIFLLYKTPLEASDPNVRRAHDLKAGNGKGFLIKPSEYGMLKSIYSEDYKEKTLWYAFYVQEITLERNIYDCQWEQMVLAQPVAYYDFQRDSDIDLITPEQLKKGTGNRAYYYPNGQPRDTNIGLYLNSAYTVSSGVPQIKSDRTIKDALKNLYYQYGFEKKCYYSNQASFCLYAINHLRFSGKIFNVYQAAKDIIQKVLPNASNIKYSDNTIQFNEAGRFHTIYVCDPINKQQDITLIINGTMLHSVSDLKLYLRNSLEPCRWFDDVVIPNITSGKDINNGQYDRSRTAAGSDRESSISRGS